MFADDFFKDVPDFRPFLFQHSLRRFDGGRHAVQFKLGVDEGLEKLQCHFFRQPALMQHQFGPDHDHRAAGIIDALSEQVLAEPALFALQHVGKGFQGPFVGAGDGAATTTVVEQGINGFLKHPLFVADNDFRGPQLDQPFQTVVAVDYAPVEVVQIRGRKAPAVQRHQGAQFRRDNGDHLEDHPFRAGAGINEGFNQLQALDQFLAFGFGIGFLEVDAKVFHLFLEVYGRQHFAQRLGADADGETVLAIFLNGGLVFIFGERLMETQFRQSGLDDYIGFEIKNALKAFQRHIEQQTDPRRQRLHKPDMGHRRGKLNVAHAFAPDLLQGYLDTAFLASNALIFHTLIFSAQAFVILCRTEYAGAE